MFAKPRPGAKESVQRRDLQVRLALERITGQSGEDENGYVTGDRRRGIELESAARAAYEVRTGSLVEAVGLFRANDLPIGCSPDGIVGDFDGGVELKAPKPAIHLRYLVEPAELRAEYERQIAHSLFVSRLPWWDLVAFCPQFPEPARLVVVRTRLEDVDLTAYESTLRRFLGEVDEQEELIRQFLATAPEVAA